MTAPQQHARPFSVPQVAERWGCSEGLVRKLIRSGELACFRPGTLIRIAAAEVERFECQQQTISTQSSASEVASPSSTVKTESASEDNSRPKIGRAPRRRRGVSGSLAMGVIRGPWVE